MLTINVNPALQGFPRPPDGGVVVPTALNFKPESIAYPPAPFVNPFPAEPTAPLAPIRPANDGQPLLPVKFVMVPPALDVDVVTNEGKRSQLVNVPNIIVTDQGSYQSTATASLVAYEIDSVVDNETHAAATATSLNLLITFVPNNKPLTSFGVSMAGRELQFVTGAWIPPSAPPPAPPSPSTPTRPILAYSAYAVVVPNLDDQKVPLFNPAGPSHGDVTAVDTARYDGELIAQNTGAGAQNVVPATQALPMGFTAPAGSFPVYLPELGESSSGLPVPEFVVNDQMLVNGTPVDFQPGINETNQSSQTQDVIVGQKTDVLGQPINVYPGAQNRH